MAGPVKTHGPSRGERQKFYSTGGSAGAALALQVADILSQRSFRRGDLKGVAAIVPLTLEYDHVPHAYQSMYTAYTEHQHGAAIINKSSMQVFYRYAGVC